MDNSFSPSPKHEQTQTLTSQGQLEASGVGERDITMKKRLVVNNHLVTSAPHTAPVEPDIGYRYYDRKVERERESERMP